MRLGLLSRHLFGKELLTRHNICSSCLSMFLHVFTSFRFGVSGRARDLIVSVPVVAVFVLHVQGNFNKL